MAAGNDNAALKATAEQLRQQVKSQQTELERLRTELEAERRRQQDELTRANAEREAAIREAAELKGQARALKTHNAELMDRLSERTAIKEKRKPE